ncbi:hypothetical protein [Streptomyces sp. RKAG293]|uniref:hypothetical protein n=1 Tax=Streptomyces sp. RKAG293 TaxID=2893403 RepID=UPI0027E5660C|nr:hypothetical protein [Streptomyces sp. RKAG293]
MTDHLSHGERLVEINDVELCVETFGSPANPAVLLVDGAAASLLWREHDLPRPLWDVFAAALIQHTSGGRP